VLACEPKANLEMEHIDHLCRYYCHAAGDIALARHAAFKELFHVAAAWYCIWVLGCMARRAADAAEDANPGEPYGFAYWSGPDFRWAAEVALTMVERIPGMAHGTLSLRSILDAVDADRCPLPALVWHSPTSDVRQVH